MGGVVVAKLGEMIRERREELGLTLDDLQVRTKIRGKYLEAIEAGEYQVIPGEVYLRGFLRSISSELEMDADLALQAYRQDTGKEKVESAQIEAAKPSVAADSKRDAAASVEQRVLAKPAEVMPVLPNRSTRSEAVRIEQRGTVPWIAIGLALLVIAAGGYWYWTSTQGQPPVDPPITQNPSQTPGTPGAEDEPTPDPEPDVVLQDPNAKDPVYLVNERVDVIVTAVSADCWLRAEWGNQVVEQTLRARSTNEASVGFQSDQQVIIKLGKAPAVKLTINGEEQPPLTGEQVRTVTIKVNP